MTWTSIAPSIARAAVSRLQVLLGKNSTQIEVRVETSGYGGTWHCVAIRQIDGRSGIWALNSVTETIGGALAVQPSPYDGQVRVTAQSGGRTRVLVDRRVVVS